MRAGAGASPPTGEEVEDLYLEGAVSNGALRALSVMGRAWFLAAALAVVFVLADGAAAESTLVLTPNRGMIGDPVRGEQPVNGCQTYRLHWEQLDGPVLGTDSGSDGRGSVSFRVPDSAGSTHTVVATCQASPGAAEQVVGGAPFTVAELGATSTVLTSTTRPATTLPATSTTPPATAGGHLSPTSTATASTRPTATTRKPPTAATTTVAPPTATTAGRRQDVADCERQAVDAMSQLVYQPARRMTVGESYEVVVSLALEASDVPAVVIPGPDRTTVVQLRTAECTIEAELTGAPDFTVTPPGPSGQSFLRTRVLTWRWQVSPNRTGPGLRLRLQLKPIIREEGRPSVPGSVDVHDAVIQVDAQPQSLVAKVDRHVNGFFDNPLAKFLLLPGGSGIVTVWVARRFRRRMT
jgi:hypothetical protein